MSIINFKNSYLELNPYDPPNFKDRGIRIQEEISVTKISSRFSQ